MTVDIFNLRLTLGEIQDRLNQHLCHSPPNGWEEKFSFDTNGDGTIGSLVDDDGNGIADGSELSAYQLISEAGAVTLKNGKGQTYSDSSTGAWDAGVRASLIGGGGGGGEGGPGEGKGGGGGGGPGTRAW